VATARSVVRDLESVLGAGAVLAEPPAEYLADQTEGRGLTVLGTQIRPSCCSGVFVDQSAESVAAAELVWRAWTDEA
jgi:hypothetical protein